MSDGAMVKTWGQRVRRLQREISERQAELSLLVAGDPSKGVCVGTMPVVDPFQAHPCDHRHYEFAKHGRRCTCGALMLDFGD